MRSPPAFCPKLSRDEAIQLADEYAICEDDAPLAAGVAIVAGECSRRHLECIFKWKTGNRGKSRLLKNSDEEIRDALRLAVDSRTPRSAIAVLTGLDGVAVPVASAIMTAIRPESFTILDFRALQALDNPTANRSLPFYLGYLGFCVELADRWRMPLRKLDRALWQWSKARGGQDAQ